MHKNNSHPYIPQADVIRILAILGVVAIHLVHPIYSRPDFLGGTTWWLTNLINTFSRTSIPLFIMLSGYLVLPKKESVQKNLDRLFHRLLIPLFFWFGFYVWWDISYLNKPQTLSDVGSMLVMSNIYHLYFLVILAGLYVLLPVFRRIMPTLTDQTARMVIKLFLGLGMLMYFCQYLLAGDQNIVSTFTIWLPYVGYFLLGGYTHLFVKENAKHLSNFLAGFVTTCILGFVNIYLLSQNVTLFWRSSGVSYFDEYLSPNVMLMSISLFLFILNSQYFLQPLFQRKAVVSTLKQLAKASFAVYLIHFVVLNVLDFRFRYAFEFLDKNMMVYFIERSILTVFISFVAAFVLIRIPIIKRVFGEK